MIFLEGTRSLTMSGQLLLYHVNAMPTKSTNLAQSPIFLGFSVVFDASHLLTGGEQVRSQID
jgi:hypothetical protein